MDIREQFNLTAKQYDKNRRNFIPCFDEFYMDSTSFIIDYIAKPKSVLDLGAGTGVLSGIWSEKLKDAKFILTDIAEDMLSIAKERFKNNKNVNFTIGDYTEKFPSGNFDSVISALSIHHIDDMKKRSLFSKIYELLPNGGLFVNYDQFCADNKNIDEAYEKYWVNFIYGSGADKTEIEKAARRRKLDKECSVSDELRMLKEAGFSPECIYKNKKFAVITGIRN